MMRVFFHANSQQQQIRGGAGRFVNKSQNIYIKVDARYRIQYSLRAAGMREKCCYLTAISFFLHTHIRE
jgi:hypothetical protein